MSKIAKNTTGSNISISDVGVTVNANSQYTIPPPDYLLWAASDDIITYMGSGDIVINDGSNDLGISDGTDLIKGIFPSTVGLTGDTDNTKIGNIGDALKVSAELTGSGINQFLIDPQTLSESFVSPAGPLEISPLVRLVGDNFITGKPLLPTLWNTDTINGGDITTVDGELSLNTNTAADGEVLIETKRIARFITGTFNLSHHAISLPNFSATDCVREWGCYDPAATSLNGVLMRNTSGVLSLVRLKNGLEDDVVAEGSFNGTSTIVKNDNIHIYEFLYNAGKIFILQDRKLIHTMGSPSSAAYGTPHLRCGVKVCNINGNTTANSIVSRGLSIARIGGTEAVPSYEYISSAGTYELKNTPGKLIRLIIGDKGTASSEITVYDGVVDPANIIAQISSNEVSNDLVYDVEFDSGLIITVTGSSIKLTAVYE